MKSIKTIYYGSTGLLSLLLTGSAIAYVLNYDFFYASFTSLGYPTYLIYPIALAKISAVITLWLPNKPNLKEWAYAGLCYDFLLALSAHLNVNHDEYISAIVALLILFMSYFSYHKIKNEALSAA